MEIDVESVEFQGEKAVATMSFRPKESDDPAAGMQMQYTLERKGTRWVVTGKPEGGGGMHGGAVESPHGAMPPAEGGMPPGHPPIEQKEADPGNTD
jgi:hypothetical protein